MKGEISMIPIEEKLRILRQTREIIEMEDELVEELGEEDPLVIEYFFYYERYIKAPEANSEKRYFEILKNLYKRGLGMSK
jgi:hypothetical protein